MNEKKIRKVYALMEKANNLSREMQILDKKISDTQEKLFGEQLGNAINNDEEFNDGLTGIGGYSNAELGTYEDFKELVNRVEKEIGGKK